MDIELRLLRSFIGRHGEGAICRAWVEITGAPPARLMSGLLRPSLDRALVMPASRPVPTKAVKQRPRQGLGLALQGIARPAPSPKGWVVRNTLIATPQAAGRPLRATVQSCGDAGTYAAAHRLHPALAARMAAWDIA
jgi:hypothetical protein